MSQRILKASYQNRPIEVLIGWDRPFGCYFMVISYAGAPGAAEPHLYSNLDDPNTEWHASFAYFAKVAARFQITLPPAMLAALEVDKPLNRGNARSIFTGNGAETPA
ncbi:conserved protein of unknown function (plasmid) [Pararobbsia alpina]|uniref:hypothetical protein n=1 Tax=Pararobbsia alpina TaxID=621374 RepID=UPI0039A63871